MPARQVPQSSRTLAAGVPSSMRNTAPELGRVSDDARQHLAPAEREDNARDLCSDQREIREAPVSESMPCIVRLWTDWAWRSMQATDRARAGCVIGHHGPSKLTCWCRLPMRGRMLHLSHEQRLLRSAALIRMQQQQKIVNAHTNLLAAVSAKFWRAFGRPLQSC